MAVSKPATAAAAVAPNGEGTGHPALSLPAPKVPATARNLYQRLRDVRLALGGTIEKGGTAPAAMGGYKFVSWDDTADRIGTLLAEHGVMVIPEIPETDVELVGTSSSGKPIYRSTASMSFEIVNVDNPDDRIVKRWKGQGDDGGDKGMQKACPSAEKYFLLKLFMLGGHTDDPDANGEDSRVDVPDAATARSTSGGARRKVDIPGQRCPQCGDQLQAIYNPDPAKKPFVGHKTWKREGACPWRPDFAAGARMIAAMEQAAPPSAALVSGGEIDPNDIPF